MKRVTFSPRPGLRLLVLIGSAWLPCTVASAQTAADSQTSVERIGALIGDAACDNDAQCRTIAIGTKACGGPEYYLAWSTKRTDAAALLDANGGSAALPLRLERPRPGVRSNCILVTDPGAYCAPVGGPASRNQPQTVNNACQLRSAQQAGRGPVD